MLDMKRSYGTIVGVPSAPGARYEQDGKMFNLDGFELEPDGKIKKETVVTELTAEQVQGMKDAEQQQARPPVQKPPEPTSPEASPVQVDHEAGKRRVYELARELGVSNDIMIVRLMGLGIDVKTHMSSVEDADVQRVMQMMARKVVIGKGN